MADRLRRLLSSDDPVIRTRSAQAGLRAACAARALQRQEPDLALFHAVPRPDGEVRQARSREPVALLRSACDGLAGPVQSPAVMGYRDDRIIVRPCGGQYHNAIAGLPTVEAAHGEWMELGVRSEKDADFAEPAMGSIRQRSDSWRLKRAREIDLPSLFAPDALIIPLQFKEADLFSNGLANVSLAHATLGTDRFGCINKKGRQATATLPEFSARAAPGWKN